MTLEVSALLVMLLSAPAPVRSVKLEQGQTRFAQGDFDGALKVLDGAALESQDSTVLVRVHLLRAQCFAARQDFSHAEDAFEHALEADPTASLDPARVDPSVVKLLDAVRGRLSGTLLVTSSPEGADVHVDGKGLGSAPQTKALPIGRHTVEVGFGGERTSSEVLVYPRRETLVAGVGTPHDSKGAPVSSTGLVLLGDFRGTLEVAADQRVPLQGAVDLGAAVELGRFRAGLDARLFPYFGVAPRVAVGVPLMDRLSVSLEAEVPVWFRGSGIALGVGGGAGAEFSPTRAFGVFVQVGGQHLFLNPGRIDDTHFTATAGVRVRAP